MTGTVLAERDAWLRLAQAATDRRHRLRLSQRQVADAGGLSLDRLQAIEGAKRTKYRAAILYSLDRGLQWTEGSAREIVLNNKQPEETGTVDQTPVPRDLIETGALSAEQTLRMLTDIHAAFGDTKFFQAIIDLADRIRAGEDRQTNTN